MLEEVTTPSVQTSNKPSIPGWIPISLGDTTLTVQSQATPIVCPTVAQIPAVHHPPPPSLPSLHQQTSFFTAQQSQAFPTPPSAAFCSAAQSQPVPTPLSATFSSATQMHQAQQSHKIVIPSPSQHMSSQQTSSQVVKTMKGSRSRSQGPPIPEEQRVHGYCHD